MVSSPSLFQPPQIPETLALFRPAFLIFHVTVINKIN
jgi:hypothetical protein